MTTLIYHHPACADHNPGPGHPESPARLDAVRSALTAPAFADLEWREAPRAALDQIARVHSKAYIDDVFAAIPAAGFASLDADTVVSPGSGEAALRAAGALCAAVDAVVAGKADNAFCAVRPPGHHAEPAQAMGFCVFNNIAIAAQQARAVHGLRRLAVFDFDVHHGNGTQTMFWDDPNLLYISTHQMPLYPGTGAPDETGVANNILNIPLRPGAGSDEFRQAVSGQVLPALLDFEPEFLFISAGFDAHEDDPLAEINLKEADYAWVTRELLGLAQRVSGSRVVSALEGGYNLEVLAASCAAHVGALMAGPESAETVR